MNNKMVITIKKRSQMGWLIWLLIVLPFLFAALIEGIGLPRGIQYILDVAWLLLLVLLTRRAKGKTTIGLLAFWSILFAVYTFMTYLPQYQSGLYYLWGIRNNFRFYAAFFAFTVFLTPEDVKSYMCLFEKLFWLNVVVSVYQFFFFQLDGDWLGGLFGTEKGCNRYTNVFFLIIVTKSIVSYLDKREKLGECLAKCSAALVVAVMAELKFFLVEFILVIAMAVLFTRFSWRKLAVIVGGLVGVVACAVLLTSLFPNFAGWFSVEWLLEAATADRGYTSSGDLNRLNAIPQINELWLKNAWQRIFGLGLGNCDTSGYDIVNTPFFRQYGGMHYTWLSYAMIYLETGWIGLIFYWGFFVQVYFKIRKIEKRSEGIIQTYCRIARIMSVLCVLISVYNSSLRSEAGYMAYFVLATPFAMSRKKKRKCDANAETVTS